MLWSGLQPLHSDPNPTPNQLPGPPKSLSPSVKWRECKMLKSDFKVLPCEC